MTKTLEERAQATVEAWEVEECEILRAPHFDTMERLVLTALREAVAEERKAMREIAKKIGCVVPDTSGCDCDEVLLAAIDARGKPAAEPPRQQGCPWCRGPIPPDEAKNVFQAGDYEFCPHCHSSFSFAKPIDARSKP